MANETTRRFIRCHDYLKENGIVKSTRQFALSIDTHAQSMNDILKGRRDATVEMLMRAAEVFGCNPEYLLLGLGDMFINQEERVYPNIQYASTPAYAGELDQYFDEVSTGSKFSLPGYDDTRGEHRCFDVKGDSMEPSLHAGDKIVCHKVMAAGGRYNIRENNVYVVVTSNEILVKRLKDNQATKGSVTMCSDNSFYSDKEIEVDQIRELWMVNMKIVPFMAHPKSVRNGIHEDIDGMRAIIGQQAQSIASLNESIERLLRKNR